MVEGDPQLTAAERVLLDSLSPDQLRAEGLDTLRIPAGEPGFVLDGIRRRAEAEGYKPPRPPVNPYIKQYAGKLGTHHIELRDPDHPELGNHLVPND